MIQLASGSTPSLSVDLQRLLHHRLRVAAAIGAAIGGVMFVAMLFIETAGTASRWSDRATVGVLIGGTFVLTAVLWSGRPFSLRRLRWLEVGVFGLQAGQIVYGMATHYSTGQIIAAAAQEQELAIAYVYADSCAMFWFALIVGYGVFIPNTARRGSGMVIGLALAALTTLAFVTLRDGAGEYLAMILFDAGVWLAAACAIAVWGCYRMNVLQREAFKAKQLGQYRLKEKLGAGGMGEVYLAEHQLLRRPCAIKVIRPDRLHDESVLARFAREVHVTAKLTHVNTVEIIDYGHAADGTFYYVMEYLPGPTLEQLMREHGPLPPGRVVYLLRQLCGALAEAHRAGLIHRDIKPGNVIVCERGGTHDVAKLLDFGLARTSLLEPQDTTAATHLGPLTVQGQITGSPAYMSPEQAAGDETLDGRSDIYSLGAVAYFLLTGSPPFTHTSLGRLLAAHLYEPVPSLASIRPETPADLASIVSRCLEKRPENRPATADDLSQSLAGTTCASAWNTELAADWWQAVRHGEVPASIATRC
jgi:serine/threonine-protein kinase